MTESSLRIVIAQGHRNSSGGNPAESARTPAIANAVAAALRAAGHDVISVQNDDGSADNWFDGSLDAVARQIMAIDRREPVDLMLDIHLEGDAGNTSGIFAIIPDGDGLQTLTPYAGSDNAASNTRDRAFAASLSAHVARTTGLPIRTRGVISPGVMSERQTYVGSSLGWRLAMFGYTAPARDHMVRIVLECGNVVADRQRIDAPKFPDRVGQGVVAGIAAIDAPNPPPDSDPAPTFGDVGQFPVPQVITVTADSLRIRKWAETDQPVIAEWNAGTQFWATGWVIGEEVEGNPVWWITGNGEAPDSGWRIWSGGTDYAGLAITPTRG